MPAPVRLVPVAPRHAAEIQRLASDPAIGATSNVPSPYPEDGAAAWIASAVEARRRGTALAFAVLGAEDRVVGVATLMAVDREAGTAGLGYWIGRPHWRRGYATAAARACVERARQLGIRRMTAACLERNAPSRRVLEKAGFHVVGPGPPDSRGPTLAYAWRSDGPAGSPNSASRAAP